MKRAFREKRHLQPGGGLQIPENIDTRARGPILLQGDYSIEESGKGLGSPLDSPSVDTPSSFPWGGVKGKDLAEV